MRSRRSSPGPATRIGTAVVWVLVAADLLLLLWVFLTSLRSGPDILRHGFGLPTSPKLGNYTTALDYGGFGRAALNSVLVSVAAAAVAVALAAPAAYALARRRSRTSSALTMTFALGLGVPGQVLVVPLFVGMANLNLTDNDFGLALVYVGLAMPFTVFLLTGFFASVPGALEEAAVLDGAGPLRSFVQVVLPVARGGLITAFLLQFIANWNETLFAIVLTNSQNKITLPVALAEFVASQQYNGMDYGTMFAGVCIILAPMIALFSWMGSRIISGMTVGIGK
ncbi:carbohydrate ABC transporter permease [Streptacidiphilus fuscans]|uniref:Carbohydrate ABC transporter permease n=1 Tax=Streptacidiphilus fuscans TaxID=2789292 RepID=A0A931FEA9_9ACTN|nr:carbohydrate ABC transporter permease [Streptacidiphilus fuscans]MBF9068990.1 carbohydrate ABC transporter permease [Streptacidiphilus fuscans]MBF9073444.1 carbohydrate ABC transporter permease [Streptacidiphilus fuscans]